PEQLRDEVVELRKVIKSIQNPERDHRSVAAASSTEMSPIPTRTRKNTLKQQAACSSSQAPTISEWHRGNVVQKLTAIQNDVNTLRDLGLTVFGGKYFSQGTIQSMHHQLVKSLRELPFPSSNPTANDLWRQLSCEEAEIVMNQLRELAGAMISNLNETYLYPETIVAHHHVMAIAFRLASTIDPDFNQYGISAGTLHDLKKSLYTPIYDPDLQFELDRLIDYFEAVNKETPQAPQDSSGNKKDKKAATPIPKKVLFDFDSWREAPGHYSFKNNAVLPAKSADYEYLENKLKVNKLKITKVMKSIRKKYKKLKEKNDELNSKIKLDEYLMIHLWSDVEVPKETRKRLNTFYSLRDFAIMTNLYLNSKPGKRILWDTDLQPEVHINLSGIFDVEIKKNDRDISRKPTFSSNEPLDNNKNGRTKNPPYDQRKLEKDHPDSKTKLHPYMHEASWRNADEFSEKSSLNQNSIHATLREELRVYYAIGEAKNLAVSQIRTFIEYEWERFSHSSNRAYVMFRLFESNTLSNEFLKHPERGAQLINTIDGALNELSLRLNKISHEREIALSVNEKNDLEIYLYLIGLKSQIIPFIEAAGVKEFDTVNGMREVRETLRSILHAKAPYPFYKYPSGLFKATQLLLSTYRHKDKKMSPNEPIDIQMILEANKIANEHMTDMNEMTMLVEKPLAVRAVIENLEQIQSVLNDDSIRSQVIQSALENVSHLKFAPQGCWNNTFPIFSSQDLNGRTIEFNVINGKLLVDNFPYENPEHPSLAFLRDFPIYQEAFQERIFSHAISKVNSNTKLYEIEDNDGLITIMLKRTSQNQFNMAVIEKSFDGENYRFIEKREFLEFCYHSGLKDYPDWNDFLLWQNIASGDIRIIHKKTNQHLYTIDRERGVIVKHASEASSTIIPAAADSVDWEDFANQSRIAARKIHEPDAAPYQEIEFLSYRTPEGHRLKFRQETSPVAASSHNTGSKIVFECDPSWYIDDNQKIKGPESFKRYLVLRNDDGKRRLLVPRQTWTESKEIAEETNKVYRCMIMELSEEGIPLPKTNEQRLFAAYYCLINNKYEEASQYLKKARRLLPYAGQELQESANRELELLSWIYKSDLENHNHIPNALAIRLHAASLAQDNLSLHKSGINTEWKRYWLANNSEKICTEYERYLSLRKHVFESLRIDVPLNPNSQRYSILQPHEEIHWLDFLISKHSDRFAQLQERLSLLKGKGTIPTEPSAFTVKNPIANFQPISIREKLSKSLSLTLEQSIEIFHTLYPRTRPGTSIEQAIPALLKIAMDGSELQQAQLAHFLNANIFDDRGAPYFNRVLKRAVDPRNPTAGTLIEMKSLLRSVDELKNEKKKIEDSLCEEELASKIAKQFPSHENSKKSARQKIDKLNRQLVKLNEKLSELDDSLINTNDATICRPGHYEESLIQRIQSAEARQTLAALPPTPATPPITLSYHRQQPSSLSTPLENPKQFKEVYFDATARTSAPITVSLPEVELPSAFSKKSYEELNHDYQVGAERNRNKPTYVLNPDLNLSTFHDQIETLTSQAEESCAIQLDALLNLARKLPEEIDLQALQKLKQYSGKKAKPELNHCIGCFLRKSPDEYLKMNPALSPEDIQELHNKIGDFLIQSTNLTFLKKVLTAAKKCKAASPADAEEKNQDLAALLAIKRARKKPEKSPEILVFEWATGFVLRPDQVEDLNTLIGNTEGKYPNKAIQRMMGAGKTAILGIILSMLKADGHHLSALIPPSALFTTNAQDIKIRSEEIFGQKAHTVIFSRDEHHFSVPYLRYVHDLFVNAIKNKDFIILSPDTLLTMENKYYEAHDRLSSLYKKIETNDVHLAASSNELVAPSLKAQKVLTKIREIESSLAVLKRILCIVDGRMAGTLDEIDEVTHLNKEHN
ncbi:MAG: DUF3638 domain-containing protein, partial [Chlamydiales bacterium]